MVTLRTFETRPPSVTVRLLPRRSPPAACKAAVSVVLNFSTRSAYWVSGWLVM